MTRALASIRFAFLCDLLVILGLAFPAGSRAQSGMALYDEQLENGWVNLSTATVSLGSTTYAHAGTRSIQVTITAGGQALFLQHSPMDTSLYGTLTFWVNGGMAIGQNIVVSALINNLPNAWVPLNSYITGGLIGSNVWRQVTIPLADLGVANTAALTGFRLQDGSGGAQRPFWVDDISLVPAPINVSVDPSQTVRVVDERVFGVNGVAWDSQSGSAQTVALVQAAGIRTIRIPGGSLSDDYHWRTNTTLEVKWDNWTWAAGFDAFSRLITGIDGQAFVTVNYGYGTPEEAAGWVAYANASATLQGTTADVNIGVDSNGFDWRTAGYWSKLRDSGPLATNDGSNFLRVSRSTPYGLKWWEIGNECYGTWEDDNQTSKHDPYTYAVRAKDYIAKMKAVDPTIKVGVVAVTGEDTNANGYAGHPATNPRTGAVHNGWTPVVLATLRSLGVTPDFVIYHRYEQGPGGESDAALLQAGRTWPNDAANLRQQLTDYLGAAGAGVELCITENNSVYSEPGKQSTSLVNGLFYADSLGNVLQTEFNSFVWWDLRNGPPTDVNGNLIGNQSASLYGWRLYGDYGILSSPSRFGSSTYYETYPVYYVMKLISHFARGGDRVVRASSDSRILSAFAAKRADNSLCLLMINKSSTDTLTPNVSLTGFTPLPTMTVYSYGIPQDEAARTGIGSADVAVSSQSLSGPSFAFSLPPYSAAVLTMTPVGAPTVTTPQNQSVKTGQAAGFTVTAGGYPAPDCQWQCSADGGTTWADLANDGTYSGVTTATLTVSNAAMVLNGNQYRCVATNTAGAATSPAAALTVSLSDEALVRLLFNDVLGRPADAGGLANLVGALAAGRTPAQVLGDLYASVEYTNRQIEPAMRLYYAALARPPDYNGLLNWSNALHLGQLTLTGAADQFASSTEFLLHYGTLNDTQYVQQLYRNVLGREADQAGLADWVGQLTGGASRGAVLVGFSESAEFKNNMAGQVEILRLYFLLLQRMPAAAELRNWIGFLKGYGQTDALYALGHPSGLSDTDYVNAVFLGFLRRAADAGALSANTAGLAAGTITHGSLVETLLNSAEFNQFVAPVSRLYLAALRRVPDQPGLNNWVNYVRGGASLQVMADAFAASQEFINRYGAMTNQQYVAQLYVDVLGRQADTAGLADWTGRLDAGTATRGGILIGFSESQEAIHLFAPTLRTFLHYFAFLNAGPTQQQLDDWKTYLATLADQLRTTLLTDPGFTGG